VVPETAATSLLPHHVSLTTHHIPVTNELLAAAAEFASMANWKESIVSRTPTLWKHTLTLTPRRETATRPDELAVYNPRIAAQFHPEDEYDDLKTLEADIMAKLDYAAKGRRRDENGEVFAWNRVGVAYYSGKSTKDRRIHKFAI
jgi:hypothetical protein